MSTVLDTPTSVTTAEPAAVRRGRLAFLTGWPVLIAAAAAGTLVVGLSYRLSASGAAANLYYLVFWLGMLLAVLPVGYRVAARNTSPTTRAWGIALVGALTFMPKYLRNPFAPSYHDEYAHWREAVDVISNQHLFQPNALIPIVQYYPGTSALTAAVQRMTGLSVWTSGELVLFVPHILVLFGVFVLACVHLRTARAGAIAALIYALNPSAVYFDTQYSYEGIAIALFVWVLALTSMAAQARGRRRIALVLAAIGCAAAIVVTHHLTTLFLTLGLGTFALLTTLRARRLARKRRPAPVANGTLVAENATNVPFVTSPRVSEPVSAAAPVVVPATDDRVVDLFVDEGDPTIAIPVMRDHADDRTTALPVVDPSDETTDMPVVGVAAPPEPEPPIDDRGTWVWWLVFAGTVVLAAVWVAVVARPTIAYLSPYFGGSVGQLSSIATKKADAGGRVLLAPSVQPLWERLLTALAPVIVGLFCLRALWLARRENRSMRSDLLALMAFGFVYFPSVVFLIAPSGAEGARRSWAFSYVGLALVGAWVIDRARTSGRFRLPPRLVTPAGIVALAVILIGNVGGGLNDPYRFPGPFRWGTDTNSASAEARTIAEALDGDVGRVKVVSDRYTALQLIAYGGLDLAGPSTGFPVWELTQLPTDPSTDLAGMLYSSGYDYLVVDARMGEEAAFNGDNYGEGDLFKGRPTPMSYLDRLDDVPWAARVMSTPNVRVYRLDLLLLGQKLQVPTAGSGS